MRAAEVHAAAIRAGATMLAEVRREVGERAWREHGDWLEDFVTSSVSGWAAQQLKRRPALRSGLVTV